MNPVAAKPNLILLHGACLNRAMWDPVRRHLDPRWRVVALDLPGHGRQAEGPYTLAAAAALVAEAARKAAPAPVVLIGDSLGGYSVLHAAASVPPAQLAGLVVGGCSFNMVGSARRTLRLRWTMTRLLLALFDEERLARGNVTRMLRRMGHEQRDIDAMIAARIRLGAFGDAAAALIGIDFRPVVAAIEAPILFVNGDRDKPAVAGEAEFVGRARRGSCERFDCEHGVTLWRPVEFAALVDRFVERVTERASA